MTNALYYSINKRDPDTSHQRSNPENKIFYEYLDHNVYTLSSGELGYFKLIYIDS